MSALTVFGYGDREVRTVVVDGEPWFVLTDLCGVLGLTTPARVAERIDEAAVSSAHISTGGQLRAVTVVNESGMYEVVIRSDKAEAVAFRRWITAEVLPAIRKTGTYSVESPEQLMARALVEAQRVLSEKDQQIAALAPAADAWNTMASSEGDYSVGDAAKILARAGISTGQQRLFQQLADFGWITRHGGRWFVMQTAVDSGYLAEKPQTRIDVATRERVVADPQVRVTLRGLERLRVRLGALVPELV